MNASRRVVRTFAAALGILASCALQAAAAWDDADSSAAPAKAESAINTPETVIQKWPGNARSAARLMISKYGEPAGFDENSLVWTNNGPWLKTVLYRKAPLSLMGSKDILEQSIVYAVPDDKIGALKSFDSRLKFDKANGELSSRAESENLNFLALNLADEIVANKRNVDEARAFYRRTIKLAASGKSSAYMDGFLFPLGVGAPVQMNGEPSPIEPPYQSGMP